MTRLFAVDHAYINGRLKSGLCAEIAGDGSLGALRPLRADERAARRAHVLMPACIDLQVNGAGGVMLNSDTTARGIGHIVETQRRLGTGWTMPTLITCEGARIRAAAAAAVECKGMRGFLGLHIEGPHINPRRMGTHRAEYIRPMDDDTLAALAHLRRHDISVLLTLAPEMVAAETIRQITDLGVIVSAGHTNATAAEMRAGLDAGITCFTHLYNAMPPMASRDPAVVGTAICSDAYIGIIADGHHVTWEMLRIAWRARPRGGRMFLVSDAMATIGGPDHFELYGERITVRDGALINAAGALAGAHIDMLGCLRNAVHHIGVPLIEAIEAACVTPADVMNVSAPALRPGIVREDFVLLDDQLAVIAH